MAINAHGQQGDGRGLRMNSVVAKTEANICLRCDSFFDCEIFRSFFGWVHQRIQRFCNLSDRFVAVGACELIPVTVGTYGARVIHLVQPLEDASIRNNTR